MQNCIDYVTISLFSNEKIGKLVLKLQGFNVFFKLKKTVFEDVLYKSLTCKRLLTNSIVKDSFEKGCINKILNLILLRILFSQLYVLMYKLRSKCLFLIHPNCLLIGYYFQCCNGLKIAIFHQMNK